MVADCQLDGGLAVAAIHPQGALQGLASALPVAAALADNAEVEKGLGPALVVEVVHHSLQLPLGALEIALIKQKDGMVVAGLGTARVESERAAKMLLGPLQLAGILVDHGQGAVDRSEEHTS